MNEDPVGQRKRYSSTFTSDNWLKIYLHSILKVLKIKSKSKHLDLTYQKVFGKKTAKVDMLQVENNSNLMPHS